MIDDEELGVRLGQELRAVAQNVTPSARLVEQVEALSRDHTRRPRWLRSRGVTRRMLLAVPVPVAAAIAAAVIVLSGSATPTSAFVLLNNGAVRVTIGQLMGVKAANSELRRLRVHNMVVVPMSASCPLHPGMSYFAGALRPAPKITLTPLTVAAGWTIVIAAERIGQNKVENAIGRFKGHLPKCVSSHGTGPGLGNWRPTKADRIK